MDSRFSLLLSSFAASFGLYSFFIRYRLDFFRPDMEPAQRIVTYLRYGWNPEIEIPLYVLGWIVVPAAGFMMYILLSRLLSRFSESIRSVSGGFLLRMTIFADVIICAVLSRNAYFIRTGQSDTGFVLILYLLFLTLLFSSTIIHPEKTGKLLHYVCVLSDICLAAGLFLLDMFLVIRLFLDPSFIPYALVPYLKANSHVFLTDFPPLLILLHFAGLGLFFFSWWKCRNIKLPRILELSRLLLYPAVFIILFAVTAIVVPQSGYGAIDPLIHDFAMILGPVNDIFGGKTFLVNSTSQYGVGLGYTMSFLFRFIPLTFNSLLLFNYILTGLCYFLFFIVLKKWLNSYLFAVFGIFLIVQQNYFTIDSSLYYGINSLSRWFWWIAIFAFLLWKENLRIPQKITEALEIVLAGWAVFWAFDVGMYIFVAYTGLIAVKGLMEGKIFSKAVRQIAIRLTLFIIGLSVYFIILNMFTFLRSGYWPDWKRMMFESAMFSGGWYQLRINLTGLFIPTLLLYVFSFLYIVQKLLNRRQISAGSVKAIYPLSFLTFYVIANLIYFVGRSHPGNLHLIVVPILFLTCWVLKYNLEKSVFFYLHSSYPSRALIAATGLFLVLTGATLLTAGDANAWNTYLKSKPFTDFDQLFREPLTAQSIAYLNTRLGNLDRRHRQLALISNKENVFSLGTRSVNVMESYTLDYFIYYSQLDRLGNQLLASGEKYVYVDHTITWPADEKVSYLFEHYVKNNFRFVNNIGYLDEFEKI